MKIILLLLLILPLLLQCRKDEEITQCTLASPGDYFPAYPGSWWEYTTNNTETVTYKISPHYQYKGYDRDNCYPVFENIGRHISGNSIMQSAYYGKGGSGIFYSPIYSENLNIEYSCVTSFSTFKFDDFIAGYPPPFKRITIFKDTTIFTNSIEYLNVIIVKEYNLHDTTHFYYDYFSKDIGLVKRDSINISDTTDLIEILTIEDYFINN